jgi:antirestriction protein ArdC
MTDAGLLSAALAVAGGTLVAAVFGGMAFFAFDIESRAMEELTAEIGAAFLSALHGLPVEERTDHAQYLASWRQAVRDKAGALLSACSKAQKAVDYLSETVGKMRGQIREVPPAG